MFESNNPYDLFAERYDQWYETPLGEAAFRQEIACLRLVCPLVEGNWLEAGVGTGRFARELGIANGIDPSLKMLGLASSRGIQTWLARAEAMPFPNDFFDGVLMAFALCFTADPVLVLRECQRVLRPGGTLLLGIVPAGSPWGWLYSRKAAAGHPLYASATFRTIAEIIAMSEKAGFVLTSTASALLSPPNEMPDSTAVPVSGAHENAGFAALCWHSVA